MREILSTKIRPWTIIDIMIFCLRLTFIRKGFSKRQIRYQHSPCLVNPSAFDFRILDNRNDHHKLFSFV